MRIVVLAGLFGMLAVTVTGASAQQSATSKVVTMTEPLVGDRWAFHVRDEITGQEKEPREIVITEVTATGVSLRLSTKGTQNSEIRSYDLLWNARDSNGWAYSPHDGLGIRTPLKVGLTWTHKSDDRERQRNTVWKRSGQTKVVAEERITTKAGTFDTFRIESSHTIRFPGNPSAPVHEISAVTWFAPAINHFVKRITTVRTDKKLKTQDTLELSEYGRKGAS